MRDSSAWAPSRRIYPCLRMHQGGKKGGITTEMKLVNEETSPLISSVKSCSSATGRKKGIQSDQSRVEMLTKAACVIVVGHGP